VKLELQFLLRKWSKIQYTRSKKIYSY